MMKRVWYLLAFNLKRGFGSFSPPYLGGFTQSHEIQAVNFGYLMER